MDDKCSDGFFSRMKQMENRFVIYAIYFMLLITFLLQFSNYRIKKPHIQKYSWKDFTAKFGKCRGKFAVYDLKTTLGKSTDFSYITIDNYSKFLDSNVSKHTTYMLKISDTNAEGCEKDILQYLSPIYKDKNNVERVMLRVQKNPWSHTAHFDSYCQEVIMLHGKKKWILFNPKFDDIDDERKFVAVCEEKKFSELENYLSSQGIPYEIKITYPGKNLYIPKGIYHATENLNIGKGTIFLNIVTLDHCDFLHDKFSIIWPEYGKRVDENFFY